jgi:hypothetical protein
LTKVEAIDAPALMSVRPTTPFLRLFHVEMRKHISSYWKRRIYGSDALAFGFLRAEHKLVGFGVTLNMVILLFSQMIRGVVK